MTADKKKLTICYLADAGSIHTLRWISYFANRGHLVHLLSFTPLEKETPKHIVFHLLENKIPLKTRRITYLLNLFPNILAIRSLIKKIKPDVVHAHDVINYGRFAAFAGFNPTVVTPWGTDVLIKSKFRAQRPLIALTLRKADLITTDGENTKNVIVKEFGIPHQKIEMIRFGVDTKKFKRLPKDEVFARELSLGKNKVVISLRTPARSHGVAILIKAIPAVLKRIPETVFIIAGDMEYDTEYVRSIIQLVETLNIGRAIRFVGKIPADELPLYINLADVYVSTALSDSGLSSSTAESMACERPVILSDSGDNKEWVENGEGGAIVPCGNPSALAEKIVELLAMPDEERKTMGAKNRILIEEKNDYAREMEKMEKLYYEIAA